MTRLVTTSVVRGSDKGESHGGVYVLDLEQQAAWQVLDWNTGDIDWRGRGADRGLRGIAFDSDRVYIAASDELFAFTPAFEKIDSWRSPFLKHCHEIFIWERMLFLTSAGYDSILGFDLDKQAFTWAINLRLAQHIFSPLAFDPMGDDGPLMLNRLHLNSVHCNKGGMYITGLKTGGMLHYNGKNLNMSVQLPAGTYNARPFRDGVVFNDTDADALRYTGRGEGDEDRAFQVPTYDESALTNWDAYDNTTARPGFARGLCVLSNRIVAAGSSPSTISLYDFAANERLGSVNLTMDVRNAIHGLDVWPYD